MRSKMGLSINSIMNRVMCLIVAFSLPFISLYGQTNVNGKIFICSEKENPDNPSIPFAKITFYLASDTTKLAYGSITDINGYYNLGEIESREYKIVITHPNYKPRAGKCDIQGEGYEYNICTNEPKRKNEVENWMVKSTSYPVADTQVQSASGVLELLQSIPMVKITQNGDVWLGEGKVKIFINGKYATQQQIDKLKAKKVESLELYDLSWSDPNPYKAVVDIITKR